jgi:hypothetical protein
MMFGRNSLAEPFVTEPSLSKVGSAIKNLKGYKWSGTNKISGDKKLSITIQPAVYNQDRHRKICELSCDSESLIL